ncbi:MAG: hypothetical protein WA390_06335 [Nitrososphaeraceae archaeon]
MTEESKSKEKEFVSEEIKIKDEVHELQAAEHEEEKEHESNQVGLLEIIPQDYSITCLS